MKSNQVKAEENNSSGSTESPNPAQVRLCQLCGMSGNHPQWLLLHRLFTCRGYRPVAPEKILVRGKRFTD